MAYVIALDLHYTFGVVKRIRNMLGSNDPPEMKMIMSGLGAALTTAYKRPLNLPEKSYRTSLQRIRKIAYEIEEMLDVAVAEQSELKVMSKPSPFHHDLSDSSPEQESMLDELQEIFHILGAFSDSREVRVSKLPQLGGAPSDSKEVTVSTLSQLGGASFDFDSKEVYSKRAYFSRLSSWEDTIVGRESEKRQIIDWIFSPSNQLRHPSVVSVSGIEGIGKTSLARLIYNDVQVSTSFALLSWAFACTLNIKSTIVEIVRSFTHQSWFYLQRMDTNTLKDRLRGILAGQKYLLVLDDIGLEQLAWWEELWEILKVGSTGSTVIVTTSWESVAREIRSNKNFELQGLPENDCWFLFTSCAGFNEVAQQRYPLLNHIGRSIVSKWHGCPLAIMTLGRMLADNRNEHLWKQTEETKVWAAFTPAYDALGISFQNMFSELAQCFVGSAILFENKLMSRDHLVYFWMAQGLLQGKNEDPRDIAHRYCNELLSLAFIQLYQSDGREIFRMCHAAQNLALDMMQQEVVRLPGTLFVEKGRHLLWTGDSISLDKGFAPYSSMLSKVRTFLFKKEVGPVSKICLQELISKLGLVRVLLLDGSEFEELPETIGNLKLLRYLSLAGNHKLKLLPDSICNLRNLQTLDLSGCEQLQTLPIYIPSLRHLLLSMELIHLPIEALLSRTSLHHLKICYCPNLNSLSEIEFPTDLRVLQIHDCSMIASLPDRISRPLFYLKELSIMNCENLDITRWGGLFGSRDLQYLQLEGLPKLSKFPYWFGNVVNSLRYFIVSSCENLADLPERLQECIHLLEMVIDNCPNIVSLPKGIHAIQTLQVLKIVNCPKLIARCESGVGEDWHLISHIPKIQLLHQVIQNRAIATLTEDTGFSGITTATLNLCKFSDCSKGARGSTGFCIAHGGDKRCQKSGCNKGAEGNTVFCKAHGGGGRCQSQGCIMNAEGGTDFSSFHGIGGLSYETSLDKRDAEVKEIEFPWASTSFQEDEDLVPKANVVEEMKDYCSVLFLLPESYEIEKDTLIQLWMASGECIKDESMELQGGEERFSFVLDSGYLLHSGTNFMTGKDTYRINIRKINELLDSQEDKRSSYLKWDNEYQKNSTPAAESIQHVSLVCNDIDETIFHTLQQFNKLRTLLFFGNLGHRVKHIPDLVFLCFDNLQALDLSKTQIRELPSSIGNMIHLRYLDLSWTLIEWLPDIICSLVELQTLKLRGCSNLLELPEQLKRLTKLRHLDLDVLRQLETMPKGMGALVNLLTLSAFLVGTEDGCKIQELKELNNLFGNLCIAKLEHVENADEAREATLYKKQHLEKLELRWTASEISGMHNNSDAILECLQPSTSLEELRILCYEGSTLPSWISNPEYNKIARIIFYKCENLLELPLIEQLPFLKHLGLTKMNSIEKIERRGKLEEDVAFPKLEKLEINEMQSLKVWDWKKRNEGDFLSLTQLIINDCPELEELDVLPHLSSIKHFEIRECPKLESLSDIKLPDSLEELIVEDCPHIQKKCIEHEGVDWYQIKHVPTKDIQEADEDEDITDFTGANY